MDLAISQVFLMKNPSAMNSSVTHFYITFHGKIVASRIFKKLAQKGGYLFRNPIYL